MSQKYDLIVCGHFQLLCDVLLTRSAGEGVCTMGDVAKAPPVPVRTTTITHYSHTYTYTHVQARMCFILYMFVCGRTSHMCVCVFSATFCQAPRSAQQRPKVSDTYPYRARVCLWLFVYLPALLALHSTSLCANSASESRGPHLRTS